MSTYVNRLIAFFALTWLISCSAPRNKYDVFAGQYNLSGYDTLYIVSCFSCSGCVKSDMDIRHFGPGTIVILDDECQTPVVRSLHPVKHANISQAALDAVFDNIANTLIVYRENGHYKLKK